ncbi:MAG TPA: hypothetical protein DIC51_06630, partial [Coxiellaceae bacterium]|nr:hypothetical protein [Coxiellaceae bacterium]
MKQENKSTLYLFAIAAIWGLTFPLMKIAIVDVTPSTFTAIRFMAAAILFIPFVFFDFFKKNSLEIIGAGVVLGLINTGVYITQAIGLKTIGSAQAAFIVGSNIILIPFLAPLFKLNKLAKTDLIAPFICLIGLFILTGSSFHFDTGELWCLLSALSVALSIVFLQFITTQKAIRAFRLIVFYQLAFTAVVPGLLMPHHDIPHLFKFSVIIPILFCALFASNIALFVQAKYQSKVSATRAALIYALEPVFASVFALIINDELITRNIFIGGCLMLFGIILHVWIENVRHQSIAPPAPSALT